MNTEPIIRARAAHCISRRDIDPDALKVLYRLIRRGYTAYLVGGGVRDLLLGRQPKDFDVSTAARPGDLKRLFRNCFLIGRRFRLAHIKYEDKIIETSTFRCQPENNGDGELLQTDDNCFGTPEEDARRRDFTINGLFYDVETFSVIDYVGGLADLEKKLVRSIGDPRIRFCEDPVRMIRAVRFASRLGFTIEDESLAAITECREEIRKASEPRLLEEIFRLFAFGSGEPAFRLLRQTRLLEILLPEVDAFITESGGEEKTPLWGYLRALDRGDMVVGQPTQPLMLAALFLPMMMHRIGRPDSSITQKSLSDETTGAIGTICERLRIPRRVRDRLERMLTTQHRFFAKTGKGFSKSRFAGQDWFPEALALYEIHLTATGKDFTRADEWRVLWESRVDEHEAVRGEGEVGLRGGRRSADSARRRKEFFPAFVEADPPEAGDCVEPDQQGETAWDDTPSANAALRSQPSTNDQEVSSGTDSSSRASNGSSIPAEGEGLSRSARRRRRKRKKKKTDQPGSQPDGQSQAQNETPAASPAPATEEKAAEPAPTRRERNERRVPRPEAAKPESVPEAQTAEGANGEQPEDDGPLNPLKVLKEQQKERRSGKKRRPPRRNERDKQIIHDNRPADAGPSYDRGSEAPHWLDEI